MSDISSVHAFHIFWYLKFAPPPPHTHTQKHIPITQLLLEGPSGVISDP